MKLIHNNEIAIALATDELTVQTIHTVFLGSLDECQSEAARLNLNDPRNVFGFKVQRPNIKGAREEASNYFNNLPEDIKSIFIPVFQAISTLKSDADAILAIKAVSVPDSLLSYKMEIMRLLNKKPLRI
jgi:hypothetical protein